MGSDIGLIEEQKEKLEELMENSDYSKLVYALRKTPPDRDVQGGLSGAMVYDKSLLRADRVIKDLPAERVVHHRNGDVTFIMKNMGCLRFINLGEFQRRVDNLMCVVHEW